ncbi:MAG: hypothetical protein AAF518_05330 [Spirochaetota bacterium]
MNDVDIVILYLSLVIGLLAAYLWASKELRAYVDAIMVVLSVTGGILSIVSYIRKR